MHDRLLTSTYLLIGARNYGVNFYRAMHYSAKCGLVIACRTSVCLSVCLSVSVSVCNVSGSGSHRLEILETYCTDI